ncbi:SRPBCC family protein [Enhygromyxa salina]|uniref:Polyketide cyclase / dehydrase and lipid transport n=1 Tax=Enhygromyxa salina TaxID=215803 RepID=A0A2S9XBX8_9BACT|nr:SRPBCC family protein [Enhygromyxa salina]PRP90363.1 Polyketide cyclase / dehydrase and lipid transport [Enhygromyxa salina]
MVRVEVNELLAAPIDALFERLVDHESYASYAGVSSATLTRAGHEARNGAGAQRRVRLGAVVLWEDIVAFERPTLMEYRIVKVRPPLVRHLLGRVSLSPEGEGTRVVWVSEFEVRIPGLGRVLEPRLRAEFDGAFRAMLHEMARRARHQTASA